MQTTFPSNTRICAQEEMNLRGRSFAADDMLHIFCCWMTLSLTRVIVSGREFRSLATQHVFAIDSVCLSRYFSARNEP